MIRVHVCSLSITITSHITVPLCTQSMSATQRSTAAHSAHPFPSGSLSPQFEQSPLRGVLADERDVAEALVQLGEERVRVTDHVEAAPEEATTSDRETVAADGQEDGTGPDGEPRRGWWQRTFGE